LLHQSTQINVSLSAWPIPCHGPHRSRAVMDAPVTAVDQTVGVAGGVQGLLQGVQREVATKRPGHTPASIRRLNTAITNLTWTKLVHAATFLRFSTHGWYGRTEGKSRTTAARGPVQSFGTLLQELATCCHNRCRVSAEAGESTSSAGRR
jgi:hypothetical protein